MMIKKSDIVREAVQKQDWKKALQIAKDFHIGVTQEQRNKMARAYECIVHPDFYRQIGINILEAIEQGKAVVKEYVEGTRRKNIMMKWDVKHDRAKRIIDAFLEDVGCWQGREELVVGLTDEEKNLVNEEVRLMIASIRKRYKLQERLTEQEAPIQLIEVKTVIPMERTKESLPEPVSEDKEPERSKRTRRASAGEKKTTSKRKEKEVQEKRLKCLSKK